MPPFFQATYWGRDIARISLPGSGIRYNLLFEMILAARWRGLSDEQFEALPPDGQARILAAYRTAMRIDAIIADEIRQSQRGISHGRPRRQR